MELLAEHPSPLADLPGELAALPTPAYVYDLAEVRRNHRRLDEALPAGTGLLYSLKANPHPDVLATLREAGCPPGGLLLRRAAGRARGRPWAGEQVLYTGPAKRDAEITAALRAGVREFSVDSPYAITQLDRLAA